MESIAIIAGSFCLASVCCGCGSLICIKKKFKCLSNCTKKNGCCCENDLCIIKEDNEDEQTDEKQAKEIKEAKI